ncbi:MAG: Rieske (2Fe-2S) protein [Proteobacteria bacterium]|nr:Rieske (2Fe-2S) protein [Pseudomonadota bacterium]
MASRSADAWARSPGVPDSHYVSGLVYTDDGVFADEKRELFGKLWQFVCHDSELPQSFDYRTVEPAGVPLILVRGADGRIRTFLNVCSHRGARLVEEPSGNAERFTCFYHLWAYDTAGACIDIPRAAGYETVGLRQEDWACGRSVPS